MDENLGNSHISKIRAAAEINDNADKVQKIVSGKVTRKKQPIGRRFAQTFFGEAGRSVLDHVVNTVLIPAIKDLIVDAGTQAIQRTFYGDSRPISRNPRPSNTQTPYNRYSSSTASRYRDDPRNTHQQRRRDSYRIDEFYLPSAVEADEILLFLDDTLSKQGSVSVAQFYDAMGEESNNTDEIWGWRSLRGARRVSTGEGDYKLVLPSPEPLD
jgi:hypothetical protein